MELKLYYICKIIGIASFIWLLQAIAQRSKPKLDTNAVLYRVGSLHLVLLLIMDVLCSLLLIFIETEVMPLFVGVLCFLLWLTFQAVTYQIRVCEGHIYYRRGFTNIDIPLEEIKDIVRSGLNSCFYIILTTDKKYIVSDYLNGSVYLIQHLKKMIEFRQNEFLG